MKIRNIHARHSSGCLNGKASPLSIATTVTLGSFFSCSGEDEEEEEGAGVEGLSAISSYRGKKEQKSHNLSNLI